MDYFDFKQFRVRHDRCAMKVGTDGVLLGAWAEVEDARVLDVGCGSGLIALMAAQRGAEAVTGIEIDKEAAAQAAENAVASPWSESVHIVAANVVTWSRSEEATSCRFNCIISNPPYFRETTTAPDARRATARHATADALTHSDLVQSAHRLLPAGGSLQVILPYSAAAAFHALCALNDFSLLRRTDVQTKEGQPPRRTLLHFIKDGLATYAYLEDNHGEADNGATTLTPPTRTTLTLLTPSGQRTAAYAELTQDFYLTSPLQKSPRGAL